MKAVAAFYIIGYFVSYDKKCVVQRDALVPEANVQLGRKHSTD